MNPNILLSSSIVIILTIAIIVLYVGVILLARKIAIVKVETSTLLTNLGQYISKVFMQRAQEEFYNLPRNLIFEPGKVYINTSTKEKVAIVKTAIVTSRQIFNQFAFDIRGKDLTNKVSVEIPSIHVFYKPFSDTAPNEESLPIKVFRKQYKAEAVKQESLFM